MNNTSLAQNLSSNKIKEDLSFLKRNLLSIHPNPFFKISEKEFDKYVNNFPQKPNIFDFVKLVSSIGDSHTQVKSLMNYLGEYIFPFSSEYFQDGFYITETEKKESSNIGRKIKAINNVDINKIEKEISSLFACENIELTKERLSEWIYEPIFLEYLSITKEQYLEIKLEDTESFKITPILRQEKLFNPRNDKIKDSVTLNIRNPLKTFYFKDLSSYYIQYNRSAKESSTLITQIIEEVKKIKPQNVIIDLRNNNGGGSLVLDSLIDYLQENKNNITSYIFISRKTYSAAVVNALDLSDISGSVLMGETTSGAPTKFGQAEKDIVLPHSKIKVSIATKYFDEKEFKFGEPLKPSIEIHESIEDFLNGKDIVWEKYLSLIKEKDQSF